MNIKIPAQAELGRATLKSWKDAKTGWYPPTATNSVPTDQPETALCGWPRRPHHPTPEGAPSKLRLGGGFPPEITTGQASSPRLAPKTGARTWGTGLLRYEAFRRFGYDPDGVFSARQDSLGFADGTNARLGFAKAQRDLWSDFGGQPGHPRLANSRGCPVQASLGRGLSEAATREAATETTEHLFESLED
jgi:hypothetical protein